MEARSALQTDAGDIFGLFVLPEFQFTPEIEARFWKGFCRFNLSLPSAFRIIS